MNPSHHFATLTKLELHALADQLLEGDPAAIETCVAFLERETVRNWHGRARAKMARRLKHCPLTPEQRSRLVNAILDRLTRGQFSEQFKDQLRLALCLEPERARLTARKCLDSPADYVRRYAAWVMMPRATGTRRTQ